MDKLLIIVGGIIAVFGGLFLLSLLLAIPVMLLWDWLIPEIFGLKEITLLQAWGLTLLSGLLFKSTNK